MRLFTPTAPSTRTFADEAAGSAPDPCACRLHAGLFDELRWHFTVLPGHQVLHHLAYRGRTLRRHHPDLNAFCGLMGWCLSDILCYERIFNAYRVFLTILAKNKKADIIQANI